MMMGDYPYGCLGGWFRSALDVAMVVRNTRTVVWGMVQIRIGRSDGGKVPVRSPDGWCPVRIRLDDGWWIGLVTVALKGVKVRMCCFGGTLSGVLCIERVCSCARPPARPLLLHHPPLFVSYLRYVQNSLVGRRIGHLSRWTPPWRLILVNSSTSMNRCFLWVDFMRFRITPCFTKWLSGCLCLSQSRDIPATYSQTN